MKCYEEYCAHIKTLWREKQVILHLVHPERLELRFDPSAVQSLIHKHQLEEKAFYQCLEEIPRYLLAILNQDEELLIDMELKYYEEEGIPLAEGEQLSREVQEKLKTIEKLFYHPQLSQSLKIKQTAKTKLLSGFSWEINQKTFDHQQGRLEPLCYAQLKIEIASPPNHSRKQPWLRYILDNEPHKDEVALTLTPDDIDYLLMELTKMKKVMSLE
ncbi:hypothetical protein C1X05_02605 [Laceyella sacchari]|uniref:Uncharacterized protein n=1 Tax=Laceyella tengchongensis TaxID=574699 RepID=A0AA45WI72_9BACL|nr:hypothetical protein [Laceyella tengchongensis]AUS07824.1 hypothetical protein C1X05_02605 [Laceyella sacchari]MRG27172.1 hypothetical protein [Laceyella tengchongensis]SMP00253.1 hypothetical protein SAMN06265361_10129 [Laceyella tengchongensis]